MFIPLRIKIITTNVLDEAMVGRFNYHDAGTTIPQPGLPTKRLRHKQMMLGNKYYYMTIEGELLLSSSELKKYEEQFNIYTPEMPVSTPFQDWDALINAVKEKTPESKKIIRYLEDYGFQDLLKMRKETIVKMGDGNVKQVRWDNYLLSPEDAHGLGYDSGADYNRDKFKTLLAHAPRTLVPEVFGGKKLMVGATGSKREMKKRIGPMVDHIIAENKAETLNVLRDIFGTLQQKWCNIILGNNNENMVYGKDEAALQLSDVVETIPSNFDYLELTRLKRVLSLLRTRPASGAGHAAAISQVKDQIAEKTKLLSGKYEVIYTTVTVRLDDFVSALTTELKAAGYQQSDGAIVSRTSLQNVPRLIGLLDTGASGLRSDLYKLIQESAELAFRKPLSVTTIAKDGTITFAEPHHNAEMEPETPEEAGEIKQARERVAKWKKGKLKLGGNEDDVPRKEPKSEEEEDEETKKEIDDIVNMIRGEP
jgi:hypothetical protein